MHHTPVIRLYKDSDKEALRQLVIESNVFQKNSLEREALDIDSVKKQTSNLFEDVLQHTDQQYIVAEIEENLVGFVLIEVSRMYVGRGSIDDLYMRSEYRGAGAGKKLLAAALEWLKNKGVKKVGLGVHKSNETAIYLYKSLGFQEVPETYLSLEKKL